MKLAFSTKEVRRGSFLDLCKTAYDYGYAGFELYDALAERKNQKDSILIRGNVPDAKRKLHIRGLSVAALTVPGALD